MAARNVNGRLELTGVYQKPPASFLMKKNKLEFCNIFYTVFLTYFSFNRCGFLPLKCITLLE